MAINKESKGFGMPWEDEYGHTFSGGAIRRRCDVRHSSLNSEAERQTMQSNQLVATENRSSVTSLVAGVLAIWLGIVFLLGASGAFVRGPGEWPLPILIGFAVPIVVFFFAFAVSGDFRDLTRSVDLPLVTGIQAWRFAGLGFLALYAHGVLPGLFAWPAGLGDIAIGITAPWVAFALARHPNFPASRLFIGWNLLGILDLIVAVGTGALSSALAVGIPGEVTTAPMAQLPLVLIPVYFVPLFVMLHIAALYQSRRFVVLEHSRNVPTNRVSRLRAAA